MVAIGARWRRSTEKALLMQLMKPRTLQSLLSVGCAALLLSACATTNSNTIAQTDGRTQLVDAHIGQSYEAVLANANARYKVEPHCEARKVALSTQRKAFAYDSCAFNPDNASYADAPLSEVVFHFIGGSLVRVDLRAVGKGDLLDKVRGDMESFFASKGTKVELLEQGSYEWVGSNEVAGVRQGGGASSGNIHVRLFDKSLKKDAAWLTDE